MPLSALCLQRSPCHAESVSLLAREAASAPALARTAVATNAAAFAELAARLRATPPRLVATCARGSSDHAATYAGYVLQWFLGRPVASLFPSTVSIYARPLDDLRGALVIAISQSGQSPDLHALVSAARTAGALVVGLVNDARSPLAAACDVAIDIGAGPENSVAATKSFLLSCVSILQLAASWSHDPALAEALSRAPSALDEACALDWSPALAPLVRASSLYVLARGIGLAAAQEVALKLKETCRLHAEPFSAAEVIHGPLALVGPGFPILALTQPDATLGPTRSSLERLVTLGAKLAATTPIDGARLLPTVDAPAVLAPLCAVQSFYLALPALAAARGLDADAPPHLTKVTETR